MVSEAITPRLARLNGLNQRVILNLPMLPRVLVLRVVAAPHHSAAEARPKVNPRVAHIQTWLAFVTVWLRRRFQCFEMVADWCGQLKLSRSSSPILAGAARSDGSPDVRLGL